MIRPLRHFATAFTGLLIESFLDRVRNASVDIENLSHGHSDIRLAEINRASVENRKQIIIELFDAVKQRLIPSLFNRLTDISSLIKYEAVLGLCMLAKKIPGIWTSLSIASELSEKENQNVDMIKSTCYTEFLTFVKKSDNSWVRILTLDSVIEMIVYHKETGSSTQGVFCLENMSEDSYYGFFEPNCTDSKPVWLGVPDVLTNAFIFAAEMVQDSDIRVAQRAGDLFVELASYESNFSDEDISETVNLMFLLDEPLVSRKLGKFIDTVLFQNSIISTEGDLSVQLKTLATFLCTYADPNPRNFMRQKHLIAVIKAFWKQAPILERVDIIIDYLTVSFSHSYPIDNIPVGVCSDPSWATFEISQILLVIVLGILEVSNNRFFRITDKKNLPDFETLGTDTPGEFGVDSVWSRISGSTIRDFSGLESYCEQLALINSVISGLLKAAQPTPFLFDLAIAIAYEACFGVTIILKQDSILGFTPPPNLIEDSLPELCSEILKTTTRPKVMKATLNLFHLLEIQGKILGHSTGHHYSDFFRVRFFR